MQGNGGSVRLLPRTNTGLAFPQPAFMIAGRHKCAAFFMHVKSDGPRARPRAMKPTILSRGREYTSVRQPRLLCPNLLKKKGKIPAPQSSTDPAPSCSITESPPPPPPGRGSLLHPPTKRLIRRTPSIQPVGFGCARNLSVLNKKKKKQLPVNRFWAGREPELGIPAEDILWSETRLTNAFSRCVGQGRSKPTQPVGRARTYRPAALTSRSEVLLGEPPAASFPAGFRR